jgi:ribonuclease HI
LEDAFRIFTEDHADNPDPPEMVDIVPEINTINIEIYTDGSCTNNRSEKARVGAGIFVKENDPQNRTIKIPTELTQSNNMGELIAAKEAVQNIVEKSLIIHSNSKLVVNGLTKYIREWEDNGFIRKENAHMFQTQVRGRSVREQK